MSNSDVERCPKECRHEFAFIGRSNVGKSSLINMLIKQKSLAMTSATPGKTVLINHFIVNESWYMVDLPGYGYAKCSKEKRKELKEIIEGYLLKRWQMTNLFLLIDIRLEPQKIDLEFMQWLAENGIPFSIVFTKADKLSVTAGKRMTASYCKKLMEEWEELPPVFVSSSADGRGRDEILDYIEELNKLPLADGGE